MVRESHIFGDFIRTLVANVAGFGGLPVEHQVKLARMIMDAGTWRYSHTEHEGYMSAGYQQLEKSFGRGRFNAINAELGIFDVKHSRFIGSTRTAGRAYTKGYRLTEHLQKVKDDYLRPRKDAALTELLSMDAKIMHTMPSLVASLDVKGKKAKASGRTMFQQSCPVDIGLLHGRYELLAQMIKLDDLDSDDLFAREQAQEIKYQMDAACQIIRMAQTDLAGRGMVMQRYGEAESGRLYVKGATNLQTMPREVRYFALHGLFDYDIENCHYTILNQLAERHGVITENIRHYLAHKKMVRSAMAERIGINEQQVKKVLISVIYGARKAIGLRTKSGDPENAIADEIGEEKARLMFADDYFCGIYEDVRKSRNAIIKAWPVKRGKLVNDYGKGISDLKATPSQKLSHLIQGIEIKAIMVAVSLYPNEIVLLIHDGFVATRSIDVELIERRMHEATGYRFELSGGPITIPEKLLRTKV